MVQNVFRIEESIIQVHVVVVVTTQSYAGRNSPESQLEPSGVGSVVTKEKIYVLL